MERIETLSELIEDEEDLEQCNDKKRRTFGKDLKTMLYAFGDEENSCPEVIQLLEELVVNYIIDMTKLALEIGQVGKVTVEDILFLVRNDPKKYSRVKELIALNEELRKAKKIFDSVDIVK